MAIYEVINSTKGENKQNGNSGGSTDEAYVCPPERAFMIVSISYLVYTVTDGAVRMIVLFHAHNLHFGTLDIALMFVLYELCGVFTNLAGGWIGSRVGLRKTLIAGMFLQMACLGGLMGWRDEFSREEALIFVIFFQALGGIAKDFVKLSGKSTTKVAVKEGETARLLKYITRITGMKNTLKGVGHFLGTVLIEFIGLIPSLAVLLVMIVIITPLGIIYLTDDLGRSKVRPPLSWDILKKGWNVNVLSLARFFLFGCRDLWFEVALPIYLVEHGEWEITVIGLFMGGYIVIYGTIQSSSDPLVLKPLRCSPPLVKWTSVWTFMLLIPTLMMAVTLTVFGRKDPKIDPAVISPVVVVGICAFAVIFAVNSSVHSFQILQFTNKDKVAMNVGFYYMANAGGRLVGTLLSGILYEYVDFQATLWGSAVFIVASAVCALFLREPPKQTAKDCTNKDVEKCEASSKPRKNSVSSSLSLSQRDNVLKI